MPRVKRGVTAHARHKKVLNRAKGYRGARKNVFRVANQAVTKAGQYAYRDRRQKKRQFRALWIARINAAARLNGMSYSRFMNGLSRAEIDLDRKVLADIAVHDSGAFSALAELVGAALSSWWCLAANHCIRKGIRIERSSAFTLSICAWHLQIND